MRSPEAWRRLERSYLLRHDLSKRVEDDNSSVCEMRSRVCLTGKSINQASWREIWMLCECPVTIDSLPNVNAWLYWHIDTNSGLWTDQSHLNGRKTITAIDFMAGTWGGYNWSDHMVWKSFLTKGPCAQRCDIPRGGMSDFWETESHKLSRLVFVLVPFRDFFWFFVSVILFQGCRWYPGTPHGAFPKSVGFEPESRYEACRKGETR